MANIGMRCFLLTDYACVAESKLHISGGGVNLLTVSGELPSPLMLLYAAVSFTVPPSPAFHLMGAGGIRRLDFAINIQGPVEAPGPVVTGTLQIGTPGHSLTPVQANLAIPIQGVVATGVGEATLSFILDGEELATYPFLIVRGQATSPADGHLLRLPGRN